jgi:hypothetical protein
MAFGLRWTEGIWGGHHAAQLACPHTAGTLSSRPKTLLAAENEWSTIILLININVLVIKQRLTIDHRCDQPTYYHLIYNQWVMTSKLLILLDYPTEIHTREGAGPRVGSPTRGLSFSRSSRVENQYELACGMTSLQRSPGSRTMGKPTDDVGAGAAPSTPACMGFSS